MKIRPWLCLSAYLSFLGFTPGHGDSIARTHARTRIPVAPQIAKQAPPTEKKFSAVPAAQSLTDEEHDWLVRGRWAETIQIPAARGDPFDVAAISPAPPVFFVSENPPPIFPTSAPLSQITRAAQLAPIKKTTRVTSIHHAHHLLSRQSQDESASVTILSPLPTDDAVASPSSDEATIATPAPPAIDDNTNAVDMPGLIAAQSRKLSQKSKADDTVLLPVVSPAAAALESVHSNRALTPPTPVADP